MLRGRCFPLMQKISVWAVLVASGCARPTDVAGRTVTVSDAGSPEPAPQDTAGPVLYRDFPEEPLIDDADLNIAAVPGVFEHLPEGSLAPPCILEPNEGALLPSNWLRPRLDFSSVGEPNVFQIRWHAEGEANDLIAYTTQRRWAVPKDIWIKLARHVQNEPIVVSVRGARWNGVTLDSATLAAHSSFVVAPVDAPGSIVYWTPSQQSALNGFSIGDEGVVSVLRASDVQTGCIGCHSSTPDGLYLGYGKSDADFGTDTSLALSSADPGRVPEPAFITPAALELLARRTQQFVVFSPGHWARGDRLAISMWVHEGSFDLTWVDLEATSTDEGVGFGVFARWGDQGSPIHPAINHRGDTLAYTSAHQVEGTVNSIFGDDIRLIPFEGRKGGASLPLIGASEPRQNEFYPAFSPDDALIAFTRGPDVEASYDGKNSEIFVVPAQGGAAVRLAANDPPACSQKLSPGVTNSWPKWSPVAQTSAGKTYYWVTFSSRRSPAGNPQVYVAGLVRDGDQLRTFPAVYLWNQPEGDDNHTPAWDLFDPPKVAPNVH